MDNAYIPPKRQPEPCQGTGCTNQLREPSLTLLWAIPDDEDNVIGVKPPDFERHGQPRPPYWIFFRYKCSVCLHQFGFFDYLSAPVDGRRLEVSLNSQSRQGSTLPSANGPNSSRNVARGNVTRQAAGRDPANRTSSWNPLDSAHPGLAAGSSASQSVGPIRPLSVNSGRSGGVASGRLSPYSTIDQISSTPRPRPRLTAQVPLSSLATDESRLNQNRDAYQMSQSPASTTSRGSQQTRLAPYPPGLGRNPANRSAGTGFGGKRFQNHPFKGWKYVLFHEFRGENIPHQQKVFTCFACQTANKGCKIEHIPRPVLENPHELVRRHLEACQDPEQLYNSAPYLRGRLELQAGDCSVDDQQMS